MAKKEILPPSPVIPDDFDIESLKIETQLTEILSEDYIKILKKIVYEVAEVGLSEEEACLVVNFDFVTLKALREKHPLVERLFQMKNMEYKRGLLKTISARAKDGDDKLAQWLLESKYPTEFNKRKGVGGNEGDGEDLLGAAISFIQKNNSKGIVTERSGQAFLVKKGAGRQNLLSPQEALKSQAENIVERIKNG